MTDNLPALPDDVREDLLRAQADQIESVANLPRIKIMAAGAGLYEFEDTQDTVRDFTGVIVHSHRRNTLWEVPYDERTEDDDGAPGCTSQDGKYGRPREGFEHLVLDGAEAEGNEQIDCATCPYNEWDSAHLVGKRGKGKACTNQRSVYVLTEDRELPFELILPPTSLKPFDSYLASLLNQGVPVQAVATVFTQKIINKGNKWAVAQFERGDVLDQDTFNTVLQKRSKYISVLDPSEGSEAAPAPDPEDDDLPF